MWKKLFGKKPSVPAYITIVSGLPRSGTSMMMKMLEAGGLPIMMDHIRKADEDNPKGYYELEKVKKIKEDHSWLKDAYGKCFKMVSMLLLDLPENYTYKVVFMQRELNEVLMSQKKMLERHAKTLGPEDEKMRELFEKHLLNVETWLSKQPHIETLYVRYNDIMQSPASHIAKLNAFLGHSLQTDNMLTVVDDSLYRNRTRV